MDARFVCRCHRLKYLRVVCGCFCPDCGRDQKTWPIYMVRNGIWDLALKELPELHHAHHVCPPCLEQRIDQTLSKELLTPAPCNHEFWLWWMTMSSVFREERGITKDLEKIDGVVFL